MGDALEKTLKKSFQKCVTYYSSLRFFVSQVIYSPIRPLRMRAEVAANPKSR